MTRVKATNKDTKKGPMFYALVTSPSTPSPAKMKELVLRVRSTFNAQH